MNEYLDLVADRENDKPADVAMALSKNFREEVESLVQTTLLMALNDIHYQAKQMKAGRSSLDKVVEVVEGIDVLAIMGELAQWIEEERELLAEAFSKLAENAQKHSQVLDL